MMKISEAIRNAYVSQVDNNRALESRVKEVMEDLRERQWHYEGRVKDIESFGLKVESVRIPNPCEMEDFFACTLVVRTISEIRIAEARVSERFACIERRPLEDTKTRYSPENFPFDFLRLYVKMKESPALPRSSYHGIKFEVQIKTFLQHAWTIATHDLVYKTDDVQWPKARIAYQIKAMLEHAEVSIEQAETMSQSIVVNRTDDRSADLGALMRICKRQWPPERLPKDVKRLAENILNMSKRLGLRIEKIMDIIQMETDLGRGTKSLDLSPYGAVIQGVIVHERSALDAYLANARARAPIMIPAGLDPPPNPPLPASKKLIFC